MARRDGRVYFAIPWGRHTLLGTTDVDDARAPEEVGPAAEDVRYLLEETARILPDVRGAGRPVRAFAGVRPLADFGSNRGAPRGSPSANPREDRILVEDGMVTVVGGKYTTHRSLAVRVVDRLVSLDGRRAPPPATADSLLSVGRGAGIEELRRSFPRSVALPGGLSLGEAEVAYAVRFEKAKRLEDVLLRRSRLWLDGRALREAAEPAALWMARLRGWDDAARRAAVDRFRRALDDEARVIEEAIA
jgi:glycerol-3-phosphate dehydrogenase